MPTADRQFFLRIAIGYFLRQDYPNKELIILDDGRVSNKSIVPDLPGIIYIRLPGTYSIGSKRNKACEAARGEIILHMDDDDWYATDWVTKSVNLLEASDADLCGLKKLLFYNPSTDSGWKYIYPDWDRPWVAGASMSYKKSFWEKYPFEDIHVGEDNKFAWNSEARISHLDYLAGIVSILHTGNTSPKNVNDSRWQPYLTSDIERILNEDLKYYKNG